MRDYKWFKYKLEKETGLKFIVKIHQDSYEYVCVSRKNIKDLKTKIKIGKCIVFEGYKYDFYNFWICGRFNKNIKPGGIK